MIPNQSSHIRLLTFVLFSALFSCQTSTEEDSNITVQLEQTSEEMAFYDNRQSQSLLLSMRDLNPEFYRQNLERLSGIPELDSFEIITENMQHPLFFRAAVLPQSYTEEILVDSLKMSVQNSRYHVNAVSGFKDGRQILILDTNNDDDFGDEKVFTFGEDFRFFQNNSPDVNYSLEKVDSIPFVNLQYELTSKNGTDEITRAVRIYPFSNHYYTQLMGESPLKDYAVGMRLGDYWTGDLSVNQMEHSVWVQGLNNEFNSIMIKPDKFDFEAENEGFNLNFVYRLKDTVQISNELFLIDSLHLGASKLIMKKLGSSGEYFGRRIGNTLQDFHLKDLQDNGFRISEVVDDNKDYILLDFWGTWCVPCVKLTPELLRISDEYADKLDIIGIAFDDDKQDVIDYTTKNEMDWHHAFQNRDAREGIIRDLRINTYPTFILLNEDREIIYRGVASDALNTIEGIIKGAQE